MTTQSSTTSDPIWAAISALELASIRDRVASKKGIFWRMKYPPALMEKYYRQFLYLIATHPGQTVVPWSQGLDDFWHEHILDTAKYAQDCNVINGGFIHHDPKLPKGTMKYETSFQQTRKMYVSAFKDKLDRKSKNFGTGAGCATGMPSAFPSDTGGHGGGHGHGCGGHGHGGGHGCGGHGCGGHGCGGGGH